MLKYKDAAISCTLCKFGWFCALSSKIAIFKYRTQNLCRVTHIAQPMHVLYAWIELKQIDIVLQQYL